MVSARRGGPAKARYCMIAGAVQAYVRAYEKVESKLT